jgi:hypothetical protein
MTRGRGKGEEREKRGKKKRLERSEEEMKYLSIRTKQT